MLTCLSSVRSTLGRALTLLAILAPAPALAQVQFEELGKRHLPSDSEAATAVVCCDVDGDGDPDLVFANGRFGAGQQNRLYLNDGTGRFTDATASRMPTDLDDTEAVACCDVDLDGDPDLVFGNDRRQRNRLYLNDGTGTFTDATVSRMPMDSDATSAVACCDVDGDGDPDLVFGNGDSSFGGQNRLYLNDGSGTFTDATASRMPTDSDFTTAVACRDVDLDGDLDLVSGNWRRQNRLYLNDGSGTFTDATSRMPADFDFTTAVACRDVDGDGDPDLVFGNAGQNLLYLNDGTGTFTDATASRMPMDSDYTGAVACFDVDLDGDADLVFGNTGAAGERNRLYLNDGTGTFTDGTARRLPMDSDATSAVACCDVDGDGYSDLVFGNASFGAGKNRLYFNDGRGIFADATASRLPTDFDNTWSVASCDVDLDGDPDLVFGNGGNFAGEQNRLYSNDGTGTFTDATAFRLPMDSDNTWAVACCDVDGDGDPDLVFANGGQNRLYLNDGTGTFTDATATRMPLDTDRTQAVACCDVDLDGDPDLAFGNGGQNRLYLNDGMGTFADATASRMPMNSDNTWAVACCDVDLDGDFDLVFGNGGIVVGEQNRLYLNDGTGTFADATASRMPTGLDDTQAVACCDVDLDGDPDLVFGNGGFSGQQNRLYLNDGMGTFSDATASRMPIGTDWTWAVACFDVDLDGDPDLVFGDDPRQQNRLYLNDGTGTFTDATAARMPPDTDLTRTVACFDADGDGDPDLVVGNAGQNTLHLNLLRQLDAPFLLRLGRSYRLDAYARYGPVSSVDVALPAVSCATARLPLPPLGTFGLDPSCTVALPALFIPRPAGVGSVSVVVPANPSLVGVAIYAQALLVRFPVQNHLSNVTADVIFR